MENKTPRYVDTNEIIRIYKKWIEQLQSPEDAGALEGVQSCLDVLLEQPIVEAVPVVHGRWTAICNGYKWMFNCNLCNCYIEAETSRNFCPNCGAKMDAEE